MLATSELWDLNRHSPAEGPRLPGNFKYHCACPINGTHVFMGGGLSTYEYEDDRDVKKSENAFLLDLEAGVWSGLPDLPEPRFEVRKYRVGQK